MINHISIGVNNPEKAANFLAQIWNGYAFPFPPCPNSFIVLADDGIGTAVEFTPANTVLAPGEGFPSEENFDENTLTEEFEAKFVSGDYLPEYVANAYRAQYAFKRSESYGNGKSRRLANSRL